MIPKLAMSTDFVQSPLSGLNPSGQSPAPAQATHVYDVEDIWVISGANQGDALGDPFECEPGDIYQLERDAAPLRLMLGTDIDVDLDANLAGVTGGAGNLVSGVVDGAGGVPAGSAVSGGPAIARRGADAGGAEAALHLDGESHAEEEAEEVAGVLHRVRHALGGERRAPRRIMPA